MAEKESLKDKGKTAPFRKPTQNQTEPAGQEQQPPFPIPFHLARADSATIMHMQRTLGNQAVQRYLDTKAKKEPPNQFFGLKVNPDHTARPRQMPTPIQRMYMPPDDVCLTPPLASPVPTSGEGGKLPPEMSSPTSEPAANHGKVFDSPQGQQSQNTAELPPTTITGTTGRPTLYQGSTGPYVELLQNKLRGAGHTLVVDGIFGSGTKAEVKDFQKVMKLSVDGVVGAATWEALDAVSRGEPISDAEDAQFNARFEQTKVPYELGQYQACLDACLALYAEPKFASKPMFLDPVIWRIASCHHALAFDEGVTPEQKQPRLDQAISWYQEFAMREGLLPDMIANAANRIRECRLGQPPTPVKELELQKHDM